jgi:hypothetical protein
MTKTQEPSFYDRAPAEALASLERGLAQIAAGEIVELHQLDRRLKAALRKSGRAKR